MTDLELLRTQLKRLGLRTMAQVFEEEAQKAAKTQMSYTAYLAPDRGRTGQQGGSLHQCPHCQGPFAHGPHH